MISDELYNYIFSFKSIFILSDIYIQYLHAMFLLTLLYVTNITSRMWKCMGDIVSKHSSNTKSTSLFTCWPLGRIRTNFWTICETIFDYWEYRQHIYKQDKGDKSYEELFAYHKVTFCILSIWTWNPLLFPNIWTFRKTLVIKKC